MGNVCVGCGVSRRGAYSCTPYYVKWSNYKMAMAVVGDAKAKAGVTITEEGKLAMVVEIFRGMINAEKALNTLLDGQCP